VASHLSVAFLTPSVSRKAGGIFEIERRLAQSLAEHEGVDVEVFALRDEHTQDDAPLWNSTPMHAFSPKGPRQFGWSPDLRTAFMKQSADVGHLHVLWMYTSILMREWSRRVRKPYVTTLNGMLEPWALNNARWKKRLSALLYERTCLRHAACIQVNSESELRGAREFGLKNPFCIIPNGVDLPDAASALAAPPWNAALPAGKKVLLYLGRLHPKKGLANLLAAWQSLSRRDYAPLRDWSLVIAGWDQSGHGDSLKSQAEQLGVAGDIHFAGPLFVDAKTAAYQHADAFVLPSFSEGLPMVVLEAWAAGKPVLMTPECHLPEGFACGAAISTQPEPGSLATGLAKLMDASFQERAAMGQCGLDLVKRKFTWPQVAAEMHAVYGWLIGGGPPPACVTPE
jgi:poly(glycerol-phosphate) alpha-glucosyltransferase